MSDLRATVEAVSARLASRPDRARTTFRALTRATGDLRCETVVGAHRLVTDLVLTREAVGAGPTPSELVAAAVGSCVATAFVLEAARLDVPLESVEVSVEGEVDARGLFAVAPVPAGFAAVRYTVVVRSPAAHAQLREVAERVDARSPVLDDLRRAVPVACALRVLEDGAETAGGSAAG